MRAGTSRLAPVSLLGKRYDAGVELPDGEWLFPGWQAADITLTEEPTMFRMRTLIVPLAAMALTGSLAACQPDAAETGDEAAIPDEADTDAAMAVNEAAQLPDTTETAVWNHLQEADYRANWDLWPGTDELYEGTEPHGMLLTTYANATASTALAEGMVGDLPEGSIIVKENYMPDSTFAAATVMMKVDGYNVDHQDWLFAKYQPDGTVDAFGRAQGCQTCHQQAEGDDYIYTPVSGM